MEYYCGSDRPYIYLYYPQDRQEEIGKTLQMLSTEGVTFWHTDRYSRAEHNRIAGAYGVLVFVTKEAYSSEEFRDVIDTAVAQNRNILAVYLEDVSPMGNWGEMQLNSAYALMVPSFRTEEEYHRKLKEASIFQEMSVTQQQKNRQKRRGLLSVVIPVAAAAVLFVTVIYPLLIAPLVEDKKEGALSFRGLTQEELDAITEIRILGTEVLTDPAIWKTHGWIKENGEMEMEIDYEDGTIEYRNINGAGTISDLSELAQLRNLETLSLIGQQIEDISPLLQCTKLRVLGLECNPISSIEGIGELKNLERLYLSSTNVSDLTPLTGLTKLNDLLLDDTPFTEFPEELAAMENLTGICMNKYGRTNMNLPVFSGKDRIGLSLWNLTFNDYSFLSQIPEYEYLNLFVPRIGELTPVLQGKEIRKLELEAPDLASVHEFEGILGIEMLRLRNCTQLTGLEGIEQMTQLKELDLSENVLLRDLTPLKNVPDLQKLILNPSAKDLAEEQLQGVPFEIVYQS